MLLSLLLALTHPSHAAGYYTSDVGVRAFSRGAASAVLVEKSRTAVELIRANAAMLRCADRIRVVSGDVKDAWSAVLQAGPFDLVLADPPYAGGHELKLLESDLWPRLLGEGGVFCLEWGRQKSTVSEVPDETPFLVKVREKTYGDSVLTTSELKDGISAVSPA